MGYIIINRDEDEMSGVRSHMRNTMMNRGGSSAMMRHQRDDEREKMYEMGFRHGWEDADDEHYRRMRDSRGRYI